MNHDIESACNQLLQRAARFTEANLMADQAKNILSGHLQTTPQNWQTYGWCPGPIFYGVLGNSMLFGRACAMRISLPGQDDLFTLDFVFSLEDTAYSDRNRPPIPIESGH
jgi:hypothetical protein